MRHNVQHHNTMSKQELTFLHNQDLTKNSIAPSFWGYLINI